MTVYTLLPVCATHRLSAALDTGWPALFYSCGKPDLILGRMVEAGIDACQAIHMYEKTDDYKRDCGERLTLWGGVDGHARCRGAPDDVRKGLRLASKTCAPGAGLVLGGGNSVVIATNYDNFMPMLGVVRNEGRYPISID